MFGWIEQATQTAAVERLPFALRLRQAISNCEKRRGVVAHADMTRSDLDVFGLRAWGLDTGLPGDDAVSAAEDRGGGYWRGHRKLVSRPRLVDRVPRQKLVQFGDMGRP